MSGLQPLLRFPLCILSYSISTCTFDLSPISLREKRPLQTLLLTFCSIDMDSIRTFIYASFPRLHEWWYLQIPQQFLPVLRRAAAHLTPLSHSCSQATHINVILYPLSPPPPKYFDLHSPREESGGHGDGGRPALEI